MKKNFLMVAVLLIAAMLMVVSCTPETKAENDDNGLVKVSLNTSTARSALEYSGLKLTNVRYRYKLTAQWTPTKSQDAVVGNTTNFVTFDAEGSATQNLGYVSQGLWQVDVIGSIGGKDVLNGSTKVYFNKTTGGNVVTVYVKPIEKTANAQITLNVNVNDHDAGDKYKLVYTIEDVTGEKKVTDGEMGRGDDLDSNGYRLWSVTKDGLKPGYYRVTVTMKNDTEVVGGLTKGVLLFAEDTTAKLEGYVNSMDFINGTLNVSYPTVTVSIGASAVSKDGDNYKVTYTATPGITGDNGLANGVTPTYSWYANGAKLDIENTTSEYEATYPVTEPGYKTITCIVRYTLSVPTVGEAVSYAFEGSAEKTTRVDETVVAGN